MYSIVRAGGEQIPVVIDLAHKIWRDTYVDILGKIQTDYMLALFYNNEALIKQIEKEGHKFFLLLYNEEPVGFASISEILPSCFKLHKLYVLTTRQGTGGGKALLHHIILMLRWGGAKKLLLNVNRQNYKAIKFYLRNGFLFQFEEDIDIGNGYFMNDHVFAIEF